MVKQLVMLFLFFILIYIGAYFFQRSFIYFPTTQKPNPENFNANDMQVVTIPVTDKISLNSWYKPSLDKKATILYLHGNGGHIGYRMSLVRYFLSSGFGVLLLEYRGYGGNPGKASESGFYQDGRAAIHFLQQKGVQEKHIVLYGESLGTGVATKMAKEYSVCSLILQSPYTSLSDLARYHYFWLPMSLIDKYDSLSRMQKIKVPVLMLHGKFDSIVPYSQGLTLFNAANQPKKWIEFSTKGHHNLWSARFANEVIHFINLYCS